MTAPKVFVREQDISTRVPSFPGVYGAIQIPNAPKGKIGQPVFVTSDTDLLNYFTPDQKVNVGYNMAFYSALAFLEKSNKLWVVRVDNGSKFGGAVIKQSPSTNIKLTDVKIGDIASLDLTETLVGAITAVNQLNKKFTLAGDKTTTLLAGNIINIQDSTGNDGVYTVVSSTLVLTDTEIEVSEVIADGTADGDIYKETISTNTLKIAGDVSASFKVNDLINIQDSTGNDGVYTVVSSEFNTPNTDIVVSETIVSTIADGSIYRNTIVNPDTYEFQADDLMLITGSNQGSWANDIDIKLYTHAESPDVVKEPGAFMIQVYKHSTGILLESFTCSRDIEAIDGYGTHIYVEDVLKGSNYISVVDNTNLPSTSSIAQQTTPLTLKGAVDGLPSTDSNMIAELQLLENKNEVALTVIMDGGWATPAYQQALDSLCKNRQDCVAILSTPFNVESNASYITDIVDYRKTTLNLNSSYSALYTPHLLITDRFNNRQIYVSPDGYAAAAISETAANFEIWFPPAGYRRGVINVSDVRRRFSDGELDLLYDAGVNPVKFAPGKGIAIFGQKTLSSRPSALDRLNVRLLLIVIEPAIATFLEDFLFEFNDDFTRLLIRDGINSYMQDIKARKGVYDYSAICDTTNNTNVDIDANKLNVWLFVQPTKSAEFITLSVIITKTGFDLTLAQGLLA
jgi:hypothetical protein